MLRDVQKYPDGYIRHVVSVFTPDAPWYEYCPNGEAEFREVVEAIVRNHMAENLDIRIAGVNAALCDFDSGITVNRKTTVYEWVDAYWALYRACYICIGYTESAPRGLQIFCVPEKNRSRTVH